MRNFSSTSRIRQEQGESEFAALIRVISADTDMSPFTETISFFDNIVRKVRVSNQHNPRCFSSAEMEEINQIIPKALEEAKNMIKYLHLESIFYRNTNI